MTDVEVVKVASDGDVALVCGGQKEGSKQLKIIVSSAILSLGSTVFKAMLRPSFKEGSTLASSSHVEIPLPEDDPAALLTLCKLLHLHDIAQEKQAPGHTLQLAVLADKYDCCGALRVFYRVWVQKAFDTYDEPEHFETCVKYFVACFYMKLPDLFEKFAHRLVLLAKGDITLTEASDYAGPLECVAESLNTQRTAWVAKITDFLEYLIKQELGMGYTPSATHNCRNNCTYCVDRTRAFAKWLFNSPFWPLSLISKQDIRFLVKSLKTLGSDWLGSASLCNGWGGKLCCGQMMYEPKSIDSELKDLARGIRFADFKLCLECVAGGDGQVLGRCKKGH